MLGSVDFSLSCTVTVSVSVTSLNVTLLDSTNILRNSTLFTSLSAGSSLTLGVSFRTLITSDAGQYSCVVTAEDDDGSATVSEMSNVTGNIVHHQATLIDAHFTTSSVTPYTVNPLSVSVSLDPEGTPLLAGTRRSLICAVNISDPINVSVRFIWWKNGGALPNNYSRVTNTSSGNTSTLEFNPLRTSDGAQYQCVTEVTVLGTVVMMNLSDVIDLNVTSEWRNTHTHMRTHTHTHTQWT